MLTDRGEGLAELREGEHDTACGHAERLKKANLAGLIVVRRLVQPVAYVSGPRLRRAG